MLSLSIVIPVCNERENIPRLHHALSLVLPDLGRDYEILFVDDGSTDGSIDALEALAERDPHVRVIEFRRNFGQTAAMSAGIQAARYDVVVTMDGDLQNDPADIPMMLQQIEAGYDLVHGWRKQRHDAMLNRRLPSLIANWLISKVTRFPVHDLGCTLKAIRREIAQELELYGEMHRFIPILAYRRGARCVEVVTRHHPRRFGTTKYGIGRVVRVVLDLATVKFLIEYGMGPMRFFGRIGLGCGLIGLLSAAATGWMKLQHQIDMTGNPLLLLSVASVMASLQFFGLGMLGEMGMRIFYRSEGHAPYAIRRTWNFGAQEERSLSIVRRAA